MSRPMRAPARQAGRERPFDRESIAAAIERLIALLDELDGDPDLEPSLGSIEHEPRLIRGLERDYTTSQLRWACGGSEDREDDLDSHESAECLPNELARINAAVERRAQAELEAIRTHARRNLPTVSGR